MKGIYYKLPIDFEGLIKKQDLSKIALEDSISQSIYTLMTTSLGNVSLMRPMAVNCGTRILIYSRVIMN